MDKERDRDQGAKSPSIIECGIQYVYMGADDNENVLLWVEMIVWEGFVAEEARAVL